MPLALRLDLNACSESVMRAAQPAFRPPARYLSQFGKLLKPSLPFQS